MTTTENPLARSSRSRKRARFPVLALIGALAVVFASTFGAALTVAPTVHAATTCQKYEIIGVRGSGESYTGPYGMGRRAGKAANAVINYLSWNGYVTDVDADVSKVSLNYPAVGVFDWANLTGAYRDSVQTGQANLRAQLNADVAACPHRKIFLIGYSQGAQVIHFDLNEGLPTPQVNAIAGLLLISDPVGDDSTYYTHVLNTVTGVDEGTSSGGGILFNYVVPAPVAHRTIAICLAQDGVCGGSHTNFSAHGTYDSCCSQVDILSYWGAAVARFAAPTGTSSTGAVNDQVNTTRMFVRGTDAKDHETYLANGASSWHAFTAGTGPSGTSVVSDPVAVVDHHNVIRVFVRGADGHLYERHHTVSAGWSGWTSLGGSIRGQPHAVVDGSNVVRVYVHQTGTSGHVYEVYLLDSGSAWHWYDTGLVSLGDAVPITDYDGVVRVYAINTAQNLVERYLLPGGAWSGWNEIILDGYFVDNPVPIVDPRNNIRVYVHDSYRAIWEMSLVPGHTWGVANLSLDSDRFVGTYYDPVAIADHDDIVRVYASSGNHLWERHLTPGSAWSSWYDMGGNIKKPIGAIQDLPDTLYVFVHNADNSFGQDTLRVGQTWSGIILRGGVTLS